MNPCHAQLNKAPLSGPHHVISARALEFIPGGRSGCHSHTPQTASSNGSHLKSGSHLRASGTGWTGILPGDCWSWRWAPHLPKASAPGPPRGSPAPFQGQNAQARWQGFQLVTQGSQTQGHIHSDTTLSRARGPRSEKEPWDQCCRSATNTSPKVTAL